MFITRPLDARRNRHHGIAKWMHLNVRRKMPELMDGMCVAQCKKQTANLRMKIQRKTASDDINGALPIAIDTNALDLMNASEIQQQHQRL